MMENMSELSPEIKAALDDTYGPVLAEFTLNQTPQGGAPVEIREQWIGIPLPVRERNLARLALGSIECFDFLTFSTKQNDNPVSIAGIEAVDALVVAERFEAANFWLTYQAGLFTFRVYEGELKSLE